MNDAASGEPITLSVGEIRPVALCRMQAEAYARDVARLQLPFGEFVDVPCPACGGHRPEPAFLKYGMQFDRCPECRTLYKSPRPSPEVIEHLFNPSEFIDIASRVLRPGGLMVLTCPNGDGFNTLTLGGGAVAVDSEHVNLFTPASLSALLTRSSFDVLETGTPGRLDAELVRKAALSGELDMWSQPFLDQVLVKDWDRLGKPFQAFLVANDDADGGARKRADSL